MLRLLARRLLFSVLTLVIASIVVFWGVELLPGDVATAYLGREATPARLALMRAELGLNRPATVRYLEWLGGVLRGDLGVSLALRKPIGELIGIRLRNTLFLGLTAAAIGLPLALALGVVAGLTRDRGPDLWISSLSLILMTLPEFVTGTILILLLSIKWPLFPAVTTVPPDAPLKAFLPNLVLPVATLVFVMVAHNLRMARTNLIDVMTSDYVQMAMLKGVPRVRVVLRHALPNALLPTVNLMALYIVWLIGGVVIVERVFNYPGIGTMMIQAVYDRDVPLVQAIALVLAGAYITFNLAADLLTMVLNPRLRSMRG